MPILHLAAFGDNFFGFLGREPRGVPILLVPISHFVHFQQKSLNYKLLHTRAFPEHSLGMNVEVEMTILDQTDGACFFHSFASGRVTMREVRVGIPFGESPFSSA